MLCKLLKYDLKRGILRRAYIFIPTFVLGVLSFCLFTMNRGILRQEIETLQLPIAMAEKASVGDAVFYTLSGELPYTPSELEKFSFPALWIAIYVYSGFITLTYLIRDLQGMGKLVLAKCHSRRLWWISKCLCTVAGCTINFVILIFSIFLCVVITGGDLGLKIDETVYRLVKISDIEAMIGTPTRLLSALFLSLLISVTLALAVQLLSLYLKPVVAFAGYIAILIISVYCNVSLCFPGYLMLVRNGGLVLGGLNSMWGYIITAFVFLLVFFVGCRLFDRYDVISRGRELT